MATMMAARFEKNGSYPAWVEMEAPIPQRGKSESSSMPPHLIADYWITQGQYPGKSNPRTYLEVTVLVESTQ